MRVLPYQRDPRYRVSDQGDVFGVHGQVLKGELHATKPGCTYRRVRIAGKNRYVHHLVLEVFKGSKPYGLCRRHKNGDSLDNRLRNLCYATYSKNNYDRVKHGRHHNARKTECDRGHEFTPDNTYIIPSSGSRQCRECARFTTREWKRARRAARQQRKVA